MIAADSSRRRWVVFIFLAVATSWGGATSLADDMTFPGEQWEDTSPQSQSLDEPKGGYLHGPSSTPFRPFDKPLFTPPGSRHAYWDSAMNMFGLVLTRAAGEPLETLFKRRIADPIGMNSKAWLSGGRNGVGRPETAFVGQSDQCPRKVQAVCAIIM